MASFNVFSSIEGFEFSPSQSSWSTYADLCDPNCEPTASTEVNFSSTHNSLLQVKFYAESEWADFPATLNSPDYAYCDFDIRLKPHANTSGYVYAEVSGLTFSISSVGFDTYISQPFSIYNPYPGPDVTPPTITLLGDNPLTICQNPVPPFVDPGATAVDDLDLNPSLTVTGNLDTSSVGQYTITYTATDASNNTSVETRTVNVVADTEPPVITLQGPNPKNVALNTAFTDPGATVTDNCDPTTTIYGAGTVNTSVTGSYALTYSHADSSGNQAVQKTRTVNVIEDLNVPPVVTLLGDNPLQVPVSQIHTSIFDASCLNPGVVFSDILDGEYQHVPGQQFNPNVDGSCGVWFNPPSQPTCSDMCTYFTGWSIGTYYITYGVRNSRGIVARATRTINVVADTVAPIISLVGSEIIQVAFRGTFSDPGATAFDNNCQTWGYYDINKTISPGGWVNTNVPGVYSIQYSVTDNSGNQSQATRTVVVLSDTTPPSISLTGSLTAQIKHGESWNDPGFLATDNAYAEWELENETLGSVNQNVIGTYVLTYKSTDPSGNFSTRTRTINVVPKSNPTLLINGGNQATIPQNSGWGNPWYTVSDPDEIFQPYQIEVEIAGTVNTSVIGTYQLIYTATDPLGYSTSQTLTVTVTDGIPPVLALFGPSPQTIYANPGTNYPDPGAYVYDNYDPGRTVYGSGFVDMAVPGTYTRTYVASDSAGNVAQPITREVIIAEPPDVIPPTIILLGNNPYNLPVQTNWAYVDPGYLVSDNKDTTVDVEITGEVDENVVGAYQIKYEATDDSGNKSFVTRIVNVIDTIPPEITLIGPSSPSIPRKGIFQDPGATVIDNYDLSRTIYGLGTVDNLVPGSYILTYSASDASGNAASPKTRTVTVLEDTVPPVLTLNGNPIISLAQGEPYIELGATAIDAIDGNLTVTITSTKIQ